MHVGLHAVAVVDPSQKTAPGGQLAHLESAVLLHAILTNPGSQSETLQSRHAAALGVAENVPASHTMGAVISTCGHAYPAEQLAHIASAARLHAVFLYVPGPHAVHILGGTRWPGQNWPAGHWAHWRSSVGEHGTDSYRPGLHGEHLTIIRPLGQYDTSTSQLVHTLLLVAVHAVDS